MFSQNLLISATFTAILEITIDTAMHVIGVRTPPVYGALHKRFPENYPKIMISSRINTSYRPSSMTFEVRNVSCRPNLFRLDFYSHSAKCAGYKDLSPKKNQVSWFAVRKGRGGEGRGGEGKRERFQFKETFEFSGPLTGPNLAQVPTERCKEIDQR